MEKKAAFNKVLKRMGALFGIYRILKPIEEKYYME